MSEAYLPRACVVLTTAERFCLFNAVLGEEIDARLDPESTRPLDGLLAAVALSGGTTVVLDEAHFYTADDMLDGLDCFLDGPVAQRHPMRFIVVCSRRTADDPVLAHVAMYDGIYDLIFDAQGADVSARLAEIVDCPNRRGDILEIFQCQKKQKELNNVFGTL